jgi:hypothetical protein
MVLAEFSCLGVKPFHIDCSAGASGAFYLRSEQIFIIVDGPISGWKGAFQV